MSIAGKQHGDYRQLVLAKAIVPGVMNLECDVLVFNPISIDDYLFRVERSNAEDLAYHTHSMGRGVFTIGSDGVIVNYKGVDSRTYFKDVKKINLSNLLWGIKERHEIDMVFFEHGSYKGHNKKPQIRVKGASQLQDLIREQNKINKYQNNPLIKLPRMTDVKALSREFCEKYRLPVSINITQDYIRKMNEEDQKDNIIGIIGKSRLDTLKTMHEKGLPRGQRNQTWREFFTSLSERELSVLQSIPDFWVAVEEEDRRYSLGAVFGQAVRILESPFRISDLAYYIETGNVKTIKAIIDRLRRQYSNDYLRYYAETMGKNVAGLMNEGLANHLWSHRQDFALSAEICDDAYNDVHLSLLRDDCIGRYKELKNIVEHNGDIDTTLPKDILHEYEQCRSIMIDKVKYYAQVFLFASNMKVIEDAYRMVDYSFDNCHIDRFAESFAKGLNDRAKIMGRIAFWYPQLFGEGRELELYLGKRARNTIQGYEEYISSFYHRLYIVGN